MKIQIEALLNKDENCTQDDLFNSICDGHIKGIENAIRAGVKLNEQNDLGNYPLQEAIRCHNIEVIELILNSSCQIEFYGEFDRINIIDWALEYVEDLDLDLEVIKLLFEYYEGNLNYRDDYGCTFLMKACANGRYDIVEYLLEHGCEVNLLDNNLDNCLSYATYKHLPQQVYKPQPDEKLIKLLLKHKCRIVKNLMNVSPTDICSEQSMLFPIYNILKNEENKHIE